MRNALILPICLLSLAAGCRGGATPTLTAEPADTGAGELRSVREVVQFREREQDPLQEVPPSETKAVSAAANIVVGATGRAEINWAEFVGAELLSGTDMLVSLAEPATRRVILDQAAGTARYQLFGDEPADVTVEAGWVEAKLSQGPGDMIVSYAPGDPSTVWVVAVRGSATVAMAGDDSAAPVTLEEGDGIGVANAGNMPEAMPVEMADVETWYSAVAAGTAETSILPVALTCQAARALPLRAEAAADAEETGESVSAAGSVVVLGLDETGEWAAVVLQTGPIRPTRSPWPSGTRPLRFGWVPSSSVTCNAPIEVAADLTQATVATAVATTPTPTLATPARTVIVISATPPSVTPTVSTPTATATAGAVTIEFWADDDELDAGECTDVNWRTAGIDSVWYNGSGVTGEGSREECPTSTTTYTLRVRKKDGSEVTHTVTVKVESAPAPEPTDTPVPAPPTTAPTSAPTVEPTPGPTGGAPGR